MCALLCWYRDIFSLTKNPQLLSDCVTLLVDHIKKRCSDVDVIVGLDARGFIFGSLVAQQMSLPFVPVRKEGKLPGETIKVAYTLEYAKVITLYSTHNHFCGLCPSLPGLTRGQQYVSK